MSCAILQPADAATRSNLQGTPAKSIMIFGAFFLGCGLLAGFVLLAAQSSNYFIVAKAPQTATEFQNSSQFSQMAVPIAAKQSTLQPNSMKISIAYAPSSLFYPKPLGYSSSFFGQEILNHSNFEPASTTPSNSVAFTNSTSSSVPPVLVEADDAPQVAGARPTTMSSSGLNRAAVADAGAAPDLTANVPMSTSVEIAQHVPVPMPRPHDVSLPPSRALFHAPHRQLARYDRSAPLSLQPDNRNFLERFFGIPQQTGQVQAYASPDDGVLDNSGGVASSQAFFSEGGTAIYDISAHSVHMPDGSVLEAHSGLGAMLDDPRYIATKDRGAIPPQVYNLTLRESLFHGVQALRLTPVGRGSVYGRDGFLAHTYMLGPRGDSNGCISFRNYSAFLQAFEQGAIKRLVVVAQR